MLSIALAGAALVSSQPRYNDQALEALTEPSSGFQAVLPNGLRLYVDRSDVEPGRAALVVVVLTGAACERRGEEGVAHLIEHLVASSGVQGEQPMTMAERAASFGGTLGKDFNASTHAFTTKYSLVVPSDMATINRASALAAAWIGSPDLSESAIVRESAAVREEGRSYSRSADRVRDQIAVARGLPERATLEQSISLLASQPDRVRAFHARTYRPDQTAIIVAGDVDPALIGNALAQRFETESAAPGAALSCEPNIRNEADVRYIVAHDPGLDEEIVGFRLRFPGSPKRSPFDRGLDDVLARIISTRLSRAAEGYDSPMAQRGVVTTTSDKGDDLTISLDAGIVDGRADQAIERFARVISGVDGFSAAEIDAARSDVDWPAPRAVTLSEVTERRVAQLLTGQDPTQQAEDDRLAKRAALDATADSLLRRYRFWLSGRREALLKTRDPDFSEADFERAVRDGDNAGRDAPLAAPSFELPLLKTKATPPSEAAYFLSEEGGDVRMTVEANGAVVHFREAAFDTPLEMGELQILADYRHPPLPATRRAVSELVARSGSAGLDAFELARLRREKGIVVIGPALEVWRLSLLARFPLEETETALKIAIGHVDGSGLSEASLDAWRRTSARAGSSMSKDEVLAAWLQSQPLDQTLIQGDLSVPAVADFLTEQFGDLDRASLVASSNLNTAEGRRLLARYMSIWPSARRGETGQSPRAEVYEVPKRTVVRTGDSGRVTVALMFTGGTDDPSASARLLEALRPRLEQRLIDRLRGVEQGTYSVLVNASVRYRPDQYVVSVSFDCAAENAERLEAAAMEEFDRIRFEPNPTRDDSGPTLARAANLRTAAEQILVDQGRPVERLAEQVSLGTLLDPERARVLIILPGER